MFGVVGDTNFNEPLRTMCSVWLLTVAVVRRGPGMRALSRKFLGAAVFCSADLALQG